MKIIPAAMKTSNPTGRILIADDDTLVREMLLKLLRGEGHECIGVPDAAGALAALRREPFDLLLADIEMPGNANLEMLRELPKVAPGLPVILLTGNPSVATAASSVRLSVSAYLTKPPDLGELRALVREAITNHRIYAAVREQWARLETLSRAAARQLEAQPSGADGPDTGETQRHLLLALEELLHTGTGGDTAAAHQLGRHAELVRALRGAVAVLEQTKRAFKSKQLGALREELEALVGQPKPGPGGSAS